MPSRRKYHEKECWEEFCAQHNKTGGAVPTWLSNLGSWVHSLNPTYWNDDGKDFVKKVLLATGPVILVKLGIPEPLANVVTNIVKETANGSSPPSVKQAMTVVERELRRERKKEEWENEQRGRERKQEYWRKKKEPKKRGRPRKISST